MPTTTIGKLFLIPVPIAEDSLATIPEEVKQLTVRLKYYFVENIRTARRYLKQLDKNVVIDDIQFSEISKHASADTGLLQQWLEAGCEIGIMSESGCPGIADPGSVLVARAQALGALVLPQVGPSSILLALMASGFSGQQFRFAGYLPIKGNERTKVIKQMEDYSRQRQETQIFIETPYRNMQLLQDWVKDGNSNTKLCIAANITGADQMIQIHTLAEWKKALPLFNIPKVPCIFLIAAYD